MDWIAAMIQSAADWTQQWPISLKTVLLVLVCLLSGWVAQILLHSLLKRVARRSRSRLLVHVLHDIRSPWRFLFPILAVMIVLPILQNDWPDVISICRHMTSLGLIATVAWLLLATLSASERYVKANNSLEVEDNYNARRIYTQVTVLKRSAATFIVLIAVGLALLTFPRVAQLGTSLLASAGVLGLIIGLAARPIFENLIAGVQIALTQPINLDDVVIIEGEWGWVEEITSTYVVVRVWDQRRLIVPFSKFISESFQNWTRRTSQILGTVFIYVDYTVPVQAVREELERIVRLCKHWDGRVCVLQVTDSTERAIELRALVSSANSPANWDLRVFVREKLIEYLQRDWPNCLPRARIETTGPISAEQAAAVADNQAA